MRSAKWLAVLMLLAGVAGASGPRYVTGPPFFSGPGAVPIGWKQTMLMYSTDPGDLSTAVNHAAADALVAAAAGVWNLPVANITVGKGGTLAEHVSSANTYLDSGGMEWPADVMSANAGAIPIAVVYDTDGSVTETLLGAGASLPSACRTNAVTESVDKFDPAGYILHAVIVVNGRCTGTAAAQQLELEYKLERVFGRVLGLAWSQTNDNVFTGVPTPTYNQALHWPIMHPVDILCGPYAYQCLPSPFTLRPDDVASMVLLYPVSNNGAVPAGKQPSLEGANGVQGNIAFPDGQGMTGVNVLVQRQQSSTPNVDGWYEASGVSGTGFRRAGTSPFVTAGTGAAASMGTTWQGEPGLFTIAYAPIANGAVYDDLLVTTEAVNPLYTGSYSVGPYAVGAVAPSGGPVPTQTLRLVSAYDMETLALAPPNAVAPCGTGTDGTVYTPAQMPATGWWNATLCGYGHTSYMTTNVRANRSFTVEATALDANGLATTTKAMPVIGLFAPTDYPGSLPSLGSTPSAFQALTVGTTSLTGQTAELSQVTVSVADERGDGRPDFAYQGRMFYADEIEPVRIPAAGGTVTITGTGFRAGNAVLVNGAAVTATQWTANTIVAVVPAMSTVGATNGKAVDVEVMDRGTGATANLYGALLFDASAMLPNAMILVSAPAGSLPVGTAAATAMAVRLVSDDGMTPVAGAAVVFSAAAGSASFGVCGAAMCAVLTDVTGLASSPVTPLAAGTITLQAAAGALVQSASFTGQTPAGKMILNRAPSGSQPVGVSVPTGFLVQVFAADGVTVLPNHVVTFTVPVGSAVFSTCNAAVCKGTTDGGGFAGFYVTPTGAGPVTLEAADGAVTLGASFVATEDVYTMQPVATPTPTVYATQNAGYFTVRVVGPDGVTPVGGANVTFSAPTGILFSTCYTNNCTVGTNAVGLAGLQVVPQVPGTFRVQATFGSQVLTATVVATVKTPSLRLVSAPTGTNVVGQVSASPFTVQLVDFDGVTPLAGVSVTMAGPVDSVVLNTCGYGSCKLVTDANGMVSSTVTPLAAGVIPLDALDLPLEVSTTVTAVAAGDSLRVITQPGSGTVYVGDAEVFAVQLLQPDGVTPDVGKNVIFTVTQGNFGWTGCAGATCTVVTDSNGLATVKGAAGAVGTVLVTASYESLSQGMSFSVTARADVLRLVSVPAAGAWVGSAAGTKFVVQALLADGVTAAAGRTVNLSVVSGSASLAACGGSSSCSLQTDAAGMAGTAVTPLAAGTIGLLAADGTVTQAAGFTAVNKPDVMTLLSVPGNGALVGDAASPAFAVRVLLGDGVTAAAGKSVVLSVTAGSASLQACGAASCALVTDASGLASSAVTPLAAGTIGLLAADGAVTQAAGFTAGNKPDVMTLLSAPADGSWVGEMAPIQFAVRVMKADGVTPSAGRAVLLSGPAGSVTLSACGAPSCALLTDANGVAASGVMPQMAGQINLLATAGRLTASASFAAAVRPDTLRVVSVPADGALVGDVAALPFSVQISAESTGLALAGKSVTMSVASGSARLSACGGAICVLTSDANGMVQTGVVPLAAGTVRLLASEGTGSQAASFVAVAKPDGLVVTASPAGVIYAGQAAVVSVRAMLADGVTPAAGRAVGFRLVAGGGVFSGCAGMPCAATTDAMGVASIRFAASAAGGVSVSAAEIGANSNSVAASWTVSDKPDTMVLVSAPTGNAFVGDALPVAFAVKLLAGDGVTPAVGHNVAFTVTTGAGSLAPCGAAACTVSTDVAGMAQVSVTPLAAGLLQVQAAEQSNVLTMAVNGVAKADTLLLASTPGASVRQGATAAMPLSVRLVQADGVTPVAGVNVVFAMGGRGAGAVVFGACGAGSCTVQTGTDGVAQTNVSGAAVGATVLVATPDATSGAAAISVGFQVVASDNSLNARQATTYLAESSALATVFGVSATSNDAAAVGQAVQWSGAAGVVFAGAASVTDALGEAAMRVTLGPLAGAAVAVGTGCAWTDVCASFTVTGVRLADLRVGVVSGGVQAVTGGATLQPVSVQVTDTAGHGVAAAQVTVYQTVTALVECPAQGRCPVAPVLASKVTVAVPDESGNFAVQPLVVTGTATATKVAFSVGTQGFAVAVITSSP